MKKNRLAEIAIILGIILITLISFVGIYVQNQSVMENKINGFSFGEELEGCVEVVLETKDDLSEEKMAVSKEILQKRLKDIELKEYNMYQNLENGNILLQLSEKENLTYIANCLNPQGKFEIIDSETKEVLMDSNHVEDAYTIYNTVQDGTVIYMVVDFNEEGTTKLEEISGKYLIKEHIHKEGETEEEHNDKGPQISLNLDGNTIITTGFGEKITNGIIYITVGRPTTDEDTLLAYVEESTKLAAAIKNGVMPLDYDVTSNTYITSNIMENDLKIVAYGIGAMVIISLIILVVKYRKMGLLTAISYVGFVAIYLLIIRYTDSTITFNSMCGIVMVLILNYILTLKFAKNIKNDDKIAEVKDKFKKHIVEFIMLLVPVTILTVVTAFINTAGISSLGIVLFWGIFTMLVYNLLITKNLLEVRTRK